MEQNSADSAVLSGAKFTEWVKKFNRSHYNTYVRFFNPVMTAERCEEIAKKAFDDIKPKLAEAWKVLFGADYIPEIAAPKVAFEYQPMLRVKRKFESVEYGYTDKEEVDVPYGYIDYAGQAHEIFSMKETKTNYGFGWNDRINVDETVVTDKFLCRDSDSPIFKHWIKEYLTEEQRKNGADAFYISDERPLVLSHFTVAEPTEALPDKKASYRVAPLEVDDFTKLRGELAQTNVSAANFQIGEIVKKRITGHAHAFPMHLDSVPYDAYAVFIPFAFFTYEVEAHKFTVRVDMVNGMAHYFINNPFGLTDGPDQRNSRLEEFEQKAGKHTSAGGNGGNNTGRIPLSGKVVMTVAILSIFIPIILSVIGIIVAIKAMREGSCPRNTAIVAIVICSVTLIFWSIVIFGSKYLLNNLNGELILPLLSA